MFAVLTQPFPAMQRLLLLALSLALSGSAAAQTLVYPGENEMPAREKTYSNELGIRYGTQVYLGHVSRYVPGPELQALSIDYARYNYYNIGFRTGVNYFVSGDADDYFSVPLQFTWRSRKLHAQGYANQDGGHYYDHRYYEDKEAEAGSYFFNLLLSILPSAFEAHAGFTPGMMFGPFTYTGADSSHDTDWAPYTVRHRFSCTFDAGVRLIIPIWRFNLFGDFTYHAYLTDNFRGGSLRPKRSYMGLGAGLSFNF